MTELVSKEVNAVYIGRPNDEYHMNSTKNKGWIGNPYKLIEQGGNYTPRESIEHFYEDFHNKLEASGIFRKRVNQLKGKKLYCPGCKADNEDYPCHGYVILAYLEGGKYRKNLERYLDGESWTAIVNKNDSLMDY